MKVTSQTLNQIVLTFVVAYKAKRAAVESLRESLSSAGIALDRKSLNQPVMHAIALAYGITLLPKERGAGVTWNLDDATSVAAKQCHKELLRDLFDGEAVPAKEIVKIPPAVIKLLKEIDALCATYPQMRSYCSTYVNAATTK